MKLIEINRLGYLAGKNWLQHERIAIYRRWAEAEYDQAPPDRKPDIQAAWSIGWRFGFGPVKPR